MLERRGENVIENYWWILASPRVQRLWWTETKLFNQKKLKPHAGRAWEQILRARRFGWDEGHSMGFEGFEKWQANDRRMLSIEKNFPLIHFTTSVRLFQEGYPKILLFLERRRLLDALRHHQSSYGIDINRDTRPVTAKWKYGNCLFCRPQPSIAWVFTVQCSHQWHHEQQLLTLQRAIVVHFVLLRRPSLFDIFCAQQECCRLHNDKPRKKCFWEFSCIFVRRPRPTTTSTQQ